MAVPRHGPLREPGAILLISCYELGHTPHGLAMPLAFLERAGFAPACVDLSVDRLASAQIDTARLVAISVPMHTALRMGARVAARVRAQNPGARICFFGLYAPLNAAYLRTVGASHVLGGESEAALVALAERMDGQGQGDHAGNEAGIQARRGAHTGIELVKLDFPAPRRRGLPGLERYAHLDPGDGTRRVAGYTETSRGCLDRCRHCPVPAVYGGRFFVIPAHAVLADISAQVDLGARHITFGDPDFFNGPGHGMAILRRMHARWPALTFDITAQVAHLCKHRRYLDELAELGCAFVVSAVESLSDRVLGKLQKRHRRAQVMEALALCRRAGVALRPTFVTFTPWTTLDDVRELVDFIAREDLIDHVDPVQLAIRLLVPPGSLLLENTHGNAHGDSPDDSSAAPHGDSSATRAWFGELVPGALTHAWHHEDPRVDELQRALAARVEAAARTGEDPAATFLAMREQVYRACGLHAPARLPEQRPLPRKRAPRITEPWFC